MRPFSCTIVAVVSTPLLGLACERRFALFRPAGWLAYSTTFLAPLPDMENRQSTYEAFYDLYEVSVSVVDPLAALK